MFRLRKVSPMEKYQKHTSETHTEFGQGTGTFDGMFTTTLEAILYHISRIALFTRSNTLKQGLKGTCRATHRPKQMGVYNPKLANQEGPQGSHTQSSSPGGFTHAMHIGHDGASRTFC